MRLKRSVFVGAAFALFASVCAALAQPPATPPAPAVADGVILLRAGAPDLRVSRYQHFGELQRALNEAIVTCGLDKRTPKPVALISDYGVFNATSRAAVTAVRGCANYAIPEEPIDSAITVALWNRLVPGFEPPDVVDRAFVLRLHHEGTDYDHFEWNYTTFDSTAYGTWGPDGATFGQRAEIQTIMTAVEKAAPGTLAAAFAKAEEAAPLRRSKNTTATIKVGGNKNCVGFTPLPATTSNVSVLLEVLPLQKAEQHAAVKAKLLPMFCDEARAGVWEKAFEVLGADARVREAYHALYEKRLKECAAKVYSAWPPGVKTTDTDFAFILDGCVQLSRRANPDRFKAAFSAATPDELATPAKRRLLVARKNFAQSDVWNGVPVNCETKPTEDSPKIFCDRLGRDMAYIRGLTPISTSEEKSWSNRTNRTAVDVGLADRDFAFPTHFLPIMKQRAAPSR